MAPVGETYQEWSPSPLNVYVASSIFSILVLYSVVIIWTCACCKARKREDHGGSGGKLSSTHNSADDSRDVTDGHHRTHHDKRDVKKKQHKPLTWANSVVYLDDERKKQENGDKNQGKNIGKTSDQNAHVPAMLQSTGLSPPPSLHPPSLHPEGRRTKKPNSHMPKKNSSEVEKHAAKGHVAPLGHKAVPMPPRTTPPAYVPKAHGQKTTPDHHHQHKPPSGMGAVHAATPRAQPHQPMKPMMSKPAKAASGFDKGKLEIKVITTNRVPLADARAPFASQQSSEPLKLSHELTSPSEDEKEPTVRSLLVETAPRTRR